MFLALALALSPQLPPITARQPLYLLEVAADGGWVALQPNSGDKRGEHHAQIWDLRTGTLDRVIPFENTGYGYRPVIDPRGRWMAYHSHAAGQDGYNLQLLDFRTGERKARTGLMKNGSRSLGFSADADEVYVADHEKTGGWVTHAYSTADGKLLRKFWLPDVRRFDLAPDGRTAVVEYVHVYDLCTGKAMPAALRNGPTVGFLNNSKHVATAGYRAGPHPIVVTDTTTGKVVREIDVPRQKPNDRVLLSDDGLALAVVRHGSCDLEVFDVGRDRPRFALREFTRHPDQMRFTPDGKSLIGLDKLGRFTVLDARTGKRRHALDPDSHREVRSLSFAPDGKTLIVGMSPRYARRFYTDYNLTAGQVFLWDTTTGALKHCAAGLSSDLAAVYPSPELDRALVVSGENAERAEWHDLPTGKSLGELGVKATHFAQSPDGRHIAAITGNAVARWDASTGARLADLGTDPAPHPPRFTPDGEWLLYRQTGSGVMAVRVSSGKERLMHKSAEPGAPLPLPSGDGFVSRCTPHEYMAGDICLFLDGRRVRFAATEQFHSPLAISADGKWVASGQAQQHRANPVFLWRVPTPKMLDEKTIRNGVFPPEEQRVEPRLLHAHAERVTAVAFSPDGKTLATGGTDRVIRLWDVENGTLRASLWAAPSPDPDAAPTDWVAFTPTGFYAGTDRGRAFLRNVLPERHSPDVVKAAVGGR